LSALSTRSIHSLSIREFVAGRRTPDSSAKLLQKPLVIVIFATSRDLNCFVANSPTSLLILLPIEALPSITNCITAPESRPQLSLQQRRPPAFAQAVPGRQCCRTALPLIDTRSRQLDRRFQSVRAISGTKPAPFTVRAYPRPPPNNITHYGSDSNCRNDVSRS
jgi:hypothetical protein